MNKNQLRLCSVLSFLLFLPLSLPLVQASEPALTGLAVQEKLRVPVYYAATSGFPPKSVNAFINDPMAFKMEARYIVDRFSARRNNQLWLNAMLTSNSREELRTFEDALLQFSRLIKIDMFKGDRLIFDINPVRGTAVSINNVQLGIIEDLKFQAALVSIWFGDRGPSRKFVEQISQPPSNKMARAFNDLKIQSKRSASLKRLQTAMLSAKNTNTKNTASESVKKAQQQETMSKNSVKATANPSLARKTPVKEANVKTNTLSSEAASSTQSNNVASKQPLPKPEKQAQTTAKQKQSQTAAQDALVEDIKENIIAMDSEKPLAKAAAVTQSSQKTSVSADKVAKVELLSVVDQMFNSLKLDYQAELKQYIEQNARPAPPMKVRRKPKGKATLQVFLKGEGEKVVVQDSQIIDSQFDQTLLDAMHSSLRRLKSMPPVPEAIADQLISIEVTLDFSRCKRSTSAWLCF